MSEVKRYAVDNVRLIDMGAGKFTGVGKGMSAVINGKDGISACRICGGYGEVHISVDLK